MPRQEGAHLCAVFLVQHRAGDIGDPAAGLEQRHGAVEHFGLLLLALFERAGPHAPLGVRVAAPGAGAGAGRIDQHQVACARRGRRVRCRPISACGPATLRAPERFRRSWIGASGRLSSSVAKIWPLFSIIAASASVLPPAPAQRSRTCSPRLGAGQQRGESASPRPDLEPALLRKAGSTWTPGCRPSRAMAGCAAPGRPARRSGFRSDNIGGGLVARPPSAC